MSTIKKILIDGTTISKKTDGLSQYIVNIISHLQTDGFNYTLILRDEEYPESFVKKIEERGIKIQKVKIQPIGPLRDIQFALFLLRNRKKFDMTFIFSNQFPVFLNIPTIYTIHDLIYEEYPEQLGRFSKIKRLYLRFVVKIGIKKAKKIIAVSDYTKSEIIRIHKPKDEQKIVVIHEGWEHLRSDEILKKNPAPFGKYMLYVGSSRKHKNIDKLLKAIQIIKEKLPKDYGFVFVGNTSFMNNEQKNSIAEMNKKRKIIHLTNWIEDSELAQYFKSANAFIFPSLSEGFGIPVLEAFYYKTPALLSNQASLPEVGGDAAIYFNPTDEKDIAEKIMYFIENEEEIHPALIEKGEKRLTQFSWKKAADEIITHI